MTHALGALRKTLLSNAGFGEIKDHLIYLSVFTVIIWGLGIVAFQIALARSQKDGSLGHY